MLEFISGLVFDGFLPVFSTLVGFLPTIIVLLVIISLFEQMGWVVAFGCTTLAVSAYPCNCSDCKKNIRFFTFIPCMAKLPVIMFLCAAVLGWTIFGVVFFYILAIFTGILFCGLGVLQKPAFRRATLRDYASTVFKNLLEFFKRISVGLMIAVAVLYTLQYFGLLLPIAAMLAPIFSPLGLDNPALVVALIFGLIGKEMIIGVILSFGVSNIGFTSISALCFLVFVIFYTPCLPTLTAIKAKLGTAAAVKTAAYNFFVAYFLTFAAYMVAVLISFC